MKSNKEIIGVILLLIGIFFFTSGIYHLGYHNGLEDMRRGESGLGGLAELTSALIQVMGGLVTSSIGLILKMKAQKK